MLRVNGADGEHRPGRVLRATVGLSTFRGEQEQDRELGFTTHTFRAGGGHRAGAAAFGLPLRATRADAQRFSARHGGRAAIACPSRDATEPAAEDATGRDRGSSASPGPGRAGLHPTDCLSGTVVAEEAPCRRSRGAGLLSWPLVTALPPAARRAAKPPRYSGQTASVARRHLRRPTPGLGQADAGAAAYDPPALGRLARGNQGVRGRGRGEPHRLARGLRGRA